jgi:putative ABC transport system permease protein
MTLWQTVRVTLRGIRSHPAFSVAVIATLAIGLGANAAVFSVLDALLVRALPYRNADALYDVYSYDVHRHGLGNTSYLNFRDWRDRTRTFSDLAAFQTGDATLLTGGAPARVATCAVTDQLFAVLGATAIAGRTFLPGEDRPGAPAVAIISEALWRSRFAASPLLVGSPIEVDNTPVTVVGIMPDRFRFPVWSRPIDIWMPLHLSSVIAESRNVNVLDVIGRLKAGVDPRAARAEMEAIGRQLTKEYPGQNRDRSIAIVALREDGVAGTRPSLLVLLGAVGFLLMIACTNVANLMLTRTASRREEIALRAALGASRGHLARQFLTEAVIYTLLGAVGGVGLAYGGLAVLLALGRYAIPRADAIHLNARALVYLLAVALVTGLATGIAPALQSTKDLRHRLTRRRGLRGLFVAGQIALALVLVAGAGLLLRAFLELRGTTTGLNADHVLTMHVAGEAVRYPLSTVTERLYAPILEHARSVPGVRDAGMISLLPLQRSGANATFAIEGHARPPVGQEPLAELRVVSPHYFSTMEIPLRAGRDISDEDTHTHPTVALINAALADRYLPGESPLFRRLAVGSDTLTIVGVVGSVRQIGLSAPPEAEIYIPFRQVPADLLPLLSSVTLVARTASAPLNATASLQASVNAVDPTESVYNIRTMEEVIADSLSNRRFLLTLIAALAGLSLALAAIGVSGVISYGVTQRYREIGIRLALGARPDQVLRLVIREGVALVGIGIGAGLVLVLFLHRILDHFLYGIRSNDPITLGAVILLLCSVALAAVMLPARRALRIDPLVTMRGE